jgi:hypothetical protein
MIRLAQSEEVRSAQMRKQFMPLFKSLSIHYRTITGKLYSQKRSVKNMVFILPLVLLILFVIIKVAFRDTYLNIVQEDGLLENTQAIAYLVASIVSFFVMVRFAQSRRLFETLMFFALGLGLIFVCLEEVSWGQRIFHLATPEYFRVHNRQHELTIHNLYRIQPRLNEIYIAVGLLGSLGWLIIPKKIKQSSNIAMAYLVPDWYLTFYFLPVAAIYFYFQVIIDAVNHSPTFYYLRINYFFIMRDQEPAETLLSLGFLIFVITNTLRQSRNVPDVAARNLTLQTGGT